MTSFDLASISAVIVTRGDVALEPIIASLPFDEIVIWDNSKELDRKVYGRYLGVDRTSTPYVYVQDDDAIVPALALARDFFDRDGNFRKNVILANLPPEHKTVYDGTGTTLVGFGAIFHRDLVNFEPYLDRYGEDEFFWRECDRVFTGSNLFEEVFVGIEKLPHGDRPGSMWREQRHGKDLYEVWRRVKELNSSVMERYSA